MNSIPTYEEWKNLRLSGQTDEMISNTYLPVAKVILGINLKGEGLEWK